MKSGQLLHPGESTAFGRTVGYRLGKIERVRPIEGRWLDCGCAEGDYTVALLRSGAREAVGTDVSQPRVEAAKTRWQGVSGLRFVGAAAEEMPFPDESFDGVLLNEVLEHVRDEMETLREMRRLLTPGGALFVFSPNRWFPFEGHGAVIGKVRLPFPVPLLPWLPLRLTEPMLQARTWWPRQLRNLVASAGFEIVDIDFALPLFARYRWVPAPLLRLYEQRFASLERKRWIRRFGVSTVIAARKSHDDHRT
jgi:ubiquinone/menaquinone biosynthesis C-methylase UbiE